MRRFRIASGIAILITSFLPVWAGTGITGSKHDFSAEAWNDTGEICVVCHVPHNHGRDTGRVGLLWNHELSTATYELYSSPFMKATSEQPRGPSKRCLSCHDGTVGVDAFGGRGGVKHMTGAALVGTDLRMTHPISVRWLHKGSPSSCENCHNMHGKDPRNIPFYNGYVECSSCHEPHDGVPGNNPSMLRKTTELSALCFHCHDK